METMAEIPQFDIAQIIEKQKTVSFKNSREVDSYYLDCANSLYETYEFILEGEDTFKGIDKEQALKYLETLLLQISELLDLLEDVDFDSKNLDRFETCLVELEEEIPRMQKHLAQAI